VNNVMAHGADAARLKLIDFEYARINHIGMDS
jgi:thiamine kinase-like enzyme